MYRLLVLALCLSCMKPYVAPIAPAVEIVEEEVLVTPQSLAAITLQPTTEPIVVAAAPLPELPKEPRPERLGTAQSSKKAMPPWSDDPDYAPQYRWSIPERVIEAEQVSEALLACDVDASGVASQDFFGGKNEIGLSLKVGKTFIRGGFKSADVTAPLIAIKSGESFKLNVYDRDYISSDDPIEFLTIKYKGKWPIVGDGKRVSYRCYVALREDVEELFSARLVEADKEMQRLEKLPRLELSSGDIPVMDEFGNKAKRGIESLAALVGWDDPSVVSRVKRLGELETQRREELKKATDETLAAAHSMGQPLSKENDFSATPVVHCSKKNASLYKKFDVFDDFTSTLRKTTCVIEIKVENLGVEPMKSGYFAVGPFDEVSTLNALGEEKKALFIAARVDGQLLDKDTFKEINVGQPVELIFAVDSTQFNTKKPTDKTPVLLRLLLADQKSAPSVWYVRLREESAPSTK